MQIRTRLTLLFIAIVALTILASSVFIYAFSSTYRSTEFYERLANKAHSMAKLFIDVDEVDANLLRIIENTAPSTLPEEHIYIFNSKGESIYKSINDDLIEISDNLKKKLFFEGEIKVTKDIYEIYGLRYETNGQPYLVFAAATDRFGYSKLKNLRNILVINYAVVLVIIAIGGWIFSSKALSPITGIIQKVENITETSLNLRLDEGKGQDEIEKLALTFNRMLERLELAFIMQKNFVANASHELRTPLTAMTGQLEVVLLKEREKEDYMRTIQSVLDDIRNLNIICNRLLLLAQTNTDRKDFNFVSVRVDDLLWQVQSDIRKFNPTYTVHVNFKSLPENENDFVVEGNPHLLKTALTNFAENGCKFSKNRSVDVELDFDEKNILVSFLDQGIGIRKEDFKMIFQPFYRSKDAISIPGHGLGLPLIEKIIKIHGGEISLDSVPNEYTHFKVRIPKNQV
ncbi:MAG: ATP-binding protein [Flavobacteriales bacterium]